MRELVSLSDEQQARRFGAFLAVQAIESTVDHEDGEWTIWIHRDDDREKAAEFLAQFQQDPNHERYGNAERKVRHVLKEVDRLQKQNRRRQHDLKARWSGSWWHCYPATYIMIGLSVLVSILCTDWKNIQVGPLGPVLCNDRSSVLLEKLGVATPVRVVEENGERVPYYYSPPRFPGGLSPAVFLEVLKVKAEVTWQSLALTISSGEVWRPVTPAFIHFGFLHILFNMMWLKNLGGAVEYVRGTKRFVLLCLILAVTSNIGQLFWAGPFFGGMSGVDFGLVGYVWMKGRTQPHLGIGLMQQTVVFAIMWLVLCMAGVFGPVANAAHLVGFLVGIAIGARQSIWKLLPFVK